MISKNVVTAQVAACVNDNCWFYTVKVVDYTKQCANYTIILKKIYSNMKKNPGLLFWV